MTGHNIYLFVAGAFILMALGVLSVASACFILLVRPYDLVFKLVSTKPVVWDCQHNEDMKPKLLNPT
jgi:hypothetical protein